MAHPKKPPVFEDDEDLAGEMPTGGDTPPESPVDPVSDDDLVGELEPDEPPELPAPQVEVVAEENIAENDLGSGEELPVGFSSMVTAPLVGIRVILWMGGENYLRAFYKKTRRFVDRRWQMTGEWHDAVTGKDILDKPLAWRPLKPGE